MDQQININNVSYIYNEHTQFEKIALKNINLNIKTGEFVSLIGPTGSGKSTLVRLLNGLSYPTSGEVIVNNKLINNKLGKQVLANLRSEVGMIFQFPEKQLFADTVLKEVSFGPKNIGMPKLKAESMARKTLKLVGIDEENFNKSPFDLSGGQMRLVGIADVLVMKPQIIILDEPTVGLDAKAQANIMNILQKMNSKNGVTIIMITHDMNLVANFTSHVIYLNNGTLVANQDTRSFFAEQHDEFIQPDSIQFAKLLRKQGVEFNDLPLDKNELVSGILQKIKKSGDKQ